MMIKDCKLLIELKHIHMDTNTGKVCKTKLLKYKNCLILLIILIENKTEHNLKWPYIPYHPYRMLIVGDFVSGKINALLNLIKNQADIDKIYLPICKRCI